MNRPRRNRSVMLHLGLGAFHRAHQAAYFQLLHDRGDERWVLASGNVRPDMEATANALRQQQGRFTLEEVAPTGESGYSRIASIRRVIPWQASLDPLVEVGADPETRIISFTVTEAGYYLDAQGVLDESHPDMQADLKLARSDRGGCTVYGALASVLSERSRRGSGAVTLLCCDNMRHNGALSRSGLLQFIERSGNAPLLGWVRANTSSPDSVVDRITPRPTAELRERVRAATGVVDRAPVMSEAYLQWTIEDRFCNGRPDWEQVGVQMVDRVEPFEDAKIRILNGSHSVIAWAGALLGYTKVHEAVVDERISRWVAAYLRDVIQCLEPSPVDLHQYQRNVLARFSNAALGDTLQRVTLDSFAKLKQFIVPTICERLRAGESIEGVALAPALYLRFLRQWRQGEKMWMYEDGGLSPVMARLLCEVADPIGTLCGDVSTWGSCVGDPRLYSALVRAQVQLAHDGGSRLLS